MSLFRRRPTLEDIGSERADEINEAVRRGDILFVQTSNGRRFGPIVGADYFGGDVVTVWIEPGLDWFDVPLEAEWAARVAAGEER